MVELGNKVRKIEVEILKTSLLELSNNNNNNK